MTAKNNPIKEIMITSISHSTEDPNKVVNAILNLLPEEIREETKSKIETSSYKGYYGNEIRIHKLVLRGRTSYTVFMYLICMMDEINLSIINDTLNERIDESGNLYVRLSKQDAFYGQINVQESDDSIKIIVRPRYNRPGLWAEVIKEIISRCK